MIFLRLKFLTNRGLQVEENRFGLRGGQHTCHNRKYVSMFIYTNNRFREYKCHFIPVEKRMAFLAVTALQPLAFAHSKQNFSPSRRVNSCFDDIC